MTEHEEWISRHTKLLQDAITRRGGIAPSDADAAAFIEGVITEVAAGTGTSERDVRNFITEDAVGAWALSYLNVDHGQTWTALPGVLVMSARGWIDMTTELIDQAHDGYLGEADVDAACTASLAILEASNRTAPALLPVEVAFTEQEITSIAEAVDLLGSAAFDLANQIPDAIEMPGNGLPANQVLHSTAAVGVELAGLFRTRHRHISGPDDVILYGDIVDGL